MNHDHLSTGRIGEDLACRFLEDHGIRIIERNFRTPFAEIDIIAQDADTLCFIEVKTRTNVSKALPRNAVNPAKQLKITKGAQAYLKNKGLFNTRSRFDVIEVIMDGKCKPAPALQINHIRHAFGAA
ncbi:MAG: YraN family protein [Desulfobacteraceae bacterium]|nr:MAG: YraN family protein [Desulfobacteraceae bacterium]